MTKLTKKQFSIVLLLPIIFAIVLSLPLWQLLSSTTTYTIEATSYDNIKEDTYINIPLHVKRDQLEPSLRKLTTQQNSVRKKVYAVFAVSHNKKLTLRHVQLTKPKGEVYLPATMYLYNMNAYENQDLPITLDVGRAIKYADTYNYSTTTDYKWDATLRYANGHAVITELRKPAH